MPDLAVQSLALTIRHLKEFGFERILCSGSSLRPFSSNMEMTLSANAIQQLEVYVYGAYFIITYWTVPSFLFVSKCDNLNFAYVLCMEKLAPLITSDQTKI